MPRVPRSSLVRLAAPPDAVADAAVEHLGARPAGVGTAATFEVDEPVDRQPAISLTLLTTPVDGGTDLTITSAGDIELPFFGWFFRPLVGIAHRRTRAHAIATIRGRARPASPHPRRRNRWSAYPRWHSGPSR